VTWATAGPDHRRALCTSVIVLQALAAETLDLATLIEGCRGLA